MRRQFFRRIDKLVNNLYKIKFRVRKGHTQNQYVFFGIQLFILYVITRVFKLSCF